MRLIRWFRRVAGWLGEASKVWKAIGISASAFLICWAAFPAWEPRLRIAGLLFQLMGVGTVAWGLRATRRLFRRPSLIESTLAWLGRFPRWRVDACAAPRGVSATSGVGAVAVHVTSGPPDASLEARIGALEQRQARTDELVQQMQERIHGETRSRESELDSERSERAIQDETIRKMLEEAAAGGLHLELIGVCWLVLGLFFATASIEIVKFAGVK